MGAFDRSKPISRFGRRRDYVSRLYARETRGGRTTTEAEGWRRGDGLQKVCRIVLYLHHSIYVVFLLSRAVAARENATNNPLPTLSFTYTSDKPPTASAPVDKKQIPAKKDIKKSLKGVVVKKKPKATASSATTAAFPPAKGKRAAVEDPKVEEDTKRRKVDSEPRY